MPGGGWSSRSFSVPLPASADYRAFLDEPRLARHPCRNRHFCPSGDGAYWPAVEAASKGCNLCAGRGRHRGSTHRTGFKPEHAAGRSRHRWLCVLHGNVNAAGPYSRCGDLGYGVAVSTQIIALMLGLGVVSRLASGVVADRIGAGPMLILGSSMQAAALLLYLFFNSQSSLYVISGVFGLFQGGIVPMYAVIIRKYLPPREAGVRISLVLMATVLGMACGG
jgi:hypothetical protein